MSRLEKINNFCHKYATTILVVAILFYSSLFFGISAWKYNTFSYNSLDLAIFNQVFYNSSHGRLFQLSIHEPTYLGDHLTPIILILLPFYSIFRSPLTLLLLQTLILALSAWPIYLIANKVLKSRVWSLMMGLVWLFNPLAQNANLFEFHLLPFAVFFLLWAYYFYLKKSWKIFSLFIFLSLLVREDVSLVVFMFGVLIVIQSIMSKVRKVKSLQYKKVSKIQNSKFKIINV